MPRRNEEETTDNGKETSYEKDYKENLCNVACKHHAAGTAGRVRGPGRSVQYACLPGIDRAGIGGDKRADNRHVYCLGHPYSLPQYDSVRYHVRPYAL